MRPLDPAWFCSPFDAALAREGPAAIFLRDPEGMMRFDAEWTRDAYGRAAVREPAGTAAGDENPCWVLARDRDSGYVQLVLFTSSTLLAAHPRLEFRPYGTREAALAGLAALGRPPVDKQAWSQ